MDRNLSTKKDVSKLQSNCKKIFCFLNRSNCNFKLLYSGPAGCSKGTIAGLIKGPSGLNSVGRDLTLVCGPNLSYRNTKENRYKALGANRSLRTGSVGPTKFIILEPEIRIS